MLRKGNIAGHALQVSQFSRIARITLVALHLPQARCSLRCLSQHRLHARHPQRNPLGKIPVAVPQCLAARTLKVVHPLAQPTRRRRGKRQVVERSSRVLVRQSPVALLLHLRCIVLHVRNLKQDAVNVPVVFSLGMRRVGHPLRIGKAVRPQVAARQLHRRHARLRIDPVSPLRRVNRLRILPQLGVEVGKADPAVGHIGVDLQQLPGAANRLFVIVQPVAVIHHFNAQPFPLRGPVAQIEGLLVILRRLVVVAQVVIR